MRRDIGLLAAMALGSIGGSYVLRRVEDELPKSADLDPCQRKPTLTRPQRRSVTQPVQHSHSREIARRLRQEERRLAKLATKGAGA